MSQEMNIFDLLFANRLRSLQKDVVEAVFRNPTATDKEIAEAVLCTVRTVKKWRPSASSCALILKGDCGQKTVIRLKKLPSISNNSLPQGTSK